MTENNREEKPIDEGISDLPELSGGWYIDDAELPPLNIPSEKTSPGEVLAVAPEEQASAQSQEAQQEDPSLAQTQIARLPGVALPSLNENVRLEVSGAAQVDKTETAPGVSDKPDINQEVTQVSKADSKRGDGPASGNSIQPKPVSLRENTSQWKSEATTFPPLAIDKNGMPLPRRVSEIDLSATRVSQANHPPRPVPPINKAVTRAAARHTQPINTRRTNWRKSIGCLLRTTIILLFIGILIVLIIGSFGIYQYFKIAATLPDISTLKARASQFETTRILDRNGNVLYEIIDPNAGLRTYVPLSEISPYFNCCDDCDRG